MLFANAEIECTTVIGRPAVPGDGPGDGRVLAGYTLQQQLGIGGYGEVWRAIGPGGLAKAVKILHGRYDGPQAEVELRALEKVRELRHPFLVSVERIEVVEGRLIIVTELADGSLEQRREAARREGHPGIPRDELLSYLRDAADALDFMSEKHGLQHLDIKPENLLLQGGRAKVGDLGLIKDIRQTNVSLVSGFTPLYAPPEIFEGRPSRTSDQYSLAIVYQVLLTGTPPFAGRTAAQLTSQHLTAKPDLAVLDPVDRPAVARALSKNPLARFPDCRQFIEELRQRRHAPRRSSPGNDRPPSLPTGRAPGPAGRGVEETPAGLAPVPTIPLAPPRDEPVVARRPAIIIGLGGLGRRVLEELHNRLAARVGAGRVPPSFRLLAIDSDTQEHPSGRTSAWTAAPQIDFLPIPLRDPQEYRSSARTSLEWLSRRWLFNIPRSRQVENIRPLGRLAVVDHHEAIRARLRVLLREAMAPESLKEAERMTGRPVEAGPPEVYVVAGISGGTGSGGVLDLGYLVREALHELKLSAKAPHGILLYGAAGSDGPRDIQGGNALACLRELQFFHGAGGGYPGDRGCRLPKAAHGPFEHTWYVDFGDGLRDADFQRESGSVAERLFAHLATDGRSSFEAWKRLDEEEQQATGAEMGLKTFVVGTIDDDTPAEARARAEALCAAVSDRWTARTGAGGAEAGRLSPDALLTQLQINEEQLSMRLEALVGGKQIKQLEAYFARKWPRLAAQHAEGSLTPDQIFQILENDAIPGRSGTSEADAKTPAGVVGLIREHLVQLAAKSSCAIRDWILERIDDPHGGIDAACAAAGHMVLRLNGIMMGWAPILQELEEERQALPRQPLEAGESGPAAALRAASFRYCMLCYGRAVYQVFIDCLTDIYQAAGQMAAELPALRRQLVACSTPWREATRETRLMPSLEEQMAFLSHLRGAQVSSISELLEHHRNPATLAARLTGAALEFLRRQSSREGSDADWTSQQSAGLPAFEQLVSTRLGGFGGGRRLLALVPAASAPELWRGTLTQLFGGCVSLQPSERRRLFLCCEVVGIPLERMIARLLDQRPELANLATQLHTRCDIDWTAHQP